MPAVLLSFRTSRRRSSVPNVIESPRNSAKCRKSSLLALSAFAMVTESPFTKLNKRSSEPAPVSVTRVIVASVEL